MSTNDLAYDLEVVVAGRQFFVGRSLELARRIEAALGALEPLSHRLDQGAVTTTELALLYAALLKGHPEAPSRTDLDAWIFATGVRPAGRRVSFFVLSLVMGSDLLAQVQDRLAASSPAAKEDGENGRGPFAPTAA